MKHWLILTTLLLTGAPCAHSAGPAKQDVADEDDDIELTFASPLMLPPPISQAAQAIQQRTPFSPKLSIDKASYPSLAALGGSPGPQRPPKPPQPASARPPCGSPAFTPVPAASASYFSEIPPLETELTPWQKERRQLFDVAWEKIKEDPRTGPRPVVLDKTPYTWAEKRYNSSYSTALAEAKIALAACSPAEAKILFTTIPEDDYFWRLSCIVAWHKLHPESPSLDSVINTQKIFTKCTDLQIELDFSCVVHLVEYYTLKRLFKAFVKAQWPEASITAIE